MADDSDFTLVSYGKKTRAGAAQEKPVQTEDKDMQTASAWCFKEFQQQLIPVIQDLIAECSNQDHPFIQRWLHVTSGSSKITRDSTFRAVADAFNLKDIQDYRRFLLTAPNVHQYVSFGTSDRSTTIHYSFKKRARSKLPTTYSAQRLFDSVQQLVDETSVMTPVANQSTRDGMTILTSRLPPLKEVNRILCRIQSFPLLTQRMMMEEIASRLSIQTSEYATAIMKTSAK
jgi:hypothetical protein